MTQGDAAASAGSDHPLVGQTIAGKYKIVRLLGEGGMGCVYEGEQALGTTIRKVAIKTLHKHLSHDESIKARFKREVATVAALEHPNTIQVFEFGEMEDGTLYIVMEFVRGLSVADTILKEGAMAPERVENILRQVVGSLEEAHGHGIVHRDLKPDNVVLAERAGQKDWVEVLDFGIAKRSSEHDPNEAKLTQQGMVLGTPPYMSPEQFTGQPIDARSDIYALGVMAYEMLSGRLPWEANTAWEWASKHMTEPPTPLERQPLGPNIPDRMRNAVTRALAKNRDERFGSVREFFDAFSGGSTSTALSVAAFPGGTTRIDAGGPAAPTTGPVNSSETRAKTEMATPAMGGGFPSMGQGVGTGPGAPAAVPPGPAHAPSKKGGPPMLVVGLGALAVLLFAGAGIGIAMSNKTKPPPPASLDLGDTSAPTTATPSDSVEEAPTPEVVSAAPLEAPAQIPPPVANNPGATKPTTPTTPATPKTVPTPTPVKAEPPVCKQARESKQRGQPAAIVAALEKQCRAANGTP